MEKQYITLYLTCGQTIDDAVSELLKYRDKGLLVCTSFNTHTLYSDTVTLDSAYLEVTGETKIEFDKLQREWKEKYEKQEREFKDRIPSLTEEWKKRGRKVLDEDMWEDWDKLVPIRLNDLYHGMELGACLDIIKVLNSGGTLEEAKEVIYSQDHSGMSYVLVCSMVKEFCKRGQAFVSFIQR